MLPIKIISPFILRMYFGRGNTVNAASWFIFIIFKNREMRWNKRVNNHEMIHYKQQKELFFIGWMVLYLIYDRKYGYLLNPFELEAHFNDDNSEYLTTREKFSWIKFLS